MAMNPINLWPSLGVAPAEIAAKAAWISRDHPRLAGATVMYFRTAGSLLLFSAQEFTLLPLAFFQVVVGLEKVLRAHYQNDDNAFKDLLIHAVAEEAIQDSSFSKQEPLRRLLLSRAGKRPMTCAEEFAQAIPEMRNDFIHGTYSLAPLIILHQRFRPLPWRAHSPFSIRSLQLHRLIHRRRSLPALTSMTTYDQQRLA